MNTKDKISFDDFLGIEAKLDIRIGEVVAAERIPKKDKLIKLTVSFSKKEGDEITVVTNLGEFYEPDDFATFFFPFIVNLEPVKLGGVMSEAMIIVGKSQTDGFEGNIELTYADYTMGSKLL